jgi:ATP-dependent helicase HrpB
VKNFPLPIDTALPELRAALARSANVVLQAPPGAGKSTAVPLALLDEPWLGTGRIVMLEPRRLAARAIAARMAQMLGEPVGGTVGFRTRLESKVGRETRIEVVTEGILTRWLQRDPTLERVGLVIFDEFHERSLSADLGLALSLDAQGTVREDLKMLVMSATLDTAEVAKILGDASLVSAPGRAFDVATRWRETAPAHRTRGDVDIARQCTRAVLHALENDSGDVLVFLPGQGEIRRTVQFLAEHDLPRGCRVVPLYGDLSAAEQDAAIRPSGTDERKVVVATNIAETSLTIEGVRIVVDSGLARRSRFDPATGMSRLETVRISKASADQRRGRAGRTASGVCYRLWSESEHASLATHTPPEIVDADLAPLALDLAEWGIVDPTSLRWLDPPPAATLSQARELLKSLEAIDADGRITPHGRALARLGTHPRLAHMIVRGDELGARRTALEIAAVLGERDLLQSRGPERNADLRFRIDALERGRIDESKDSLQLSRDTYVDAGARQRALRTIDVLERQLPNSQPPTANPQPNIGRLLAFAYPDRIAQARGGAGRYLLANGSGAVLPTAQSLSQSEFLVVAELTAGDREAVIRLAAPIERAAIESDFAEHIEHRQRLEWSSRERAVLAREEWWLGALKLSERRIDEPDSERLSNALIEGIRELGISVLPWTKEARSLQQRMTFARGIDQRIAQSWPDVSDEALTATMEQWLAPSLEGMSRIDHLARLDLTALLTTMLPWSERQRLDEFVPTHVRVPSGSRIPIDYSQDPPTIAVRLQEVFGLSATPTVGGGKVPLTLHLLSPAHRPVQVTKDLTSFWARGYAEVRKELKGRYPKHYWPDDPLTAEATARAKPRRT